MNSYYEDYNVHSTPIPARPVSPVRDGPFPSYYRRAEQTVSPDSNRESTSKVLPPMVGVINDDDRVEYPPLPEDEKLGYFSTIALIVSKVIGTGIFVKPAYVLQNCGGSKGIALLLWTAGGFMSICGLVIYVELGIAFPFNGAEIVYVEEAFPHPRYLAVTIVSLLFVLVTNYSGNCIMFAKLILQAFNPDDLNPDFRLVKFVAFVTLTLVCLLHTFSRRIGLAVNNLLAIYKICVIVVVIITGFVAMGLGKAKMPASDGAELVKPGPALLDKAFEQPYNTTMAEYSNAILGVLWAFTGWENANYVLGEIKRPPAKESKIFKTATFGAISLLTVLYILANIAYFGVLTTEELMIDDGQMIAGKLFMKIFGKGPFVDKGIKVIVALSVLGNFISVVFAVARVKQEIAKLRIIPFSKFWAKQSHYDTPVGALILHWVFTSISILAVPNYKSDDAYSLLTNLFIYGQNWVIILVSLALVSLRYSRKFAGWKPKLLPWKALLAIICVYIPLNIFIIVLTWWPPLVQPSIPQYVTPTVSTAVIVFGVMYWFGFAKIMPLIGYHIDSEPDELVDGSRVVTYKRYKTGLAKKMSDFYDGNVRKRYKKSG